MRRKQDGYVAAALAAAALSAAWGCGANGGDASLDGPMGTPAPTGAPTTTAPDPSATGTFAPPAGPTGVPPDPSGTPTTGPVSTTSPPAPPAYDPSVTFDWPESEPGAGSCEGGTYVGDFQCDLSFIPGFPPTVFTGPLTFTLTPSQNGEFLVIDNARFDATTNGMPFGADLVGELDCATRSFEASLNDGVYGTAPFTGTFFGTLSGEIQLDTGTLSGTWSLTAGTPAAPMAAPCIGTWTTVRQP